jgi:7,8-dihydroneopterin aldolase/epimerase/oxygenase
MPVADLIFVKGLVVHARHGVMPHEAEVGQRFLIDLELRLDLQEAADSDQLTDTISYAEVVEAALSAFVSRRVRLIEAAAGLVGDTLLQRFPRLDEVRVVVHKPHAPIAASFEDVGIALTRRRKQPV